ncbi:MAG: MBL fold metallo-hydrolase [Candidatus Eisenbacteria bacterium]|nr:MBL fold metallo-hydrolase [Candidatus Eisenbacteria bacterium]
MEIRILSTESMGTRGLCTVVETRDRRILIDPGIALGRVRHSLPPHPFQIAVGAATRKKILAEFPLATDVVFSHYHGDHIPLADANPYQLSLDRVAPMLRRCAVWGPEADDPSGRMQARHEALRAACGMDLNAAPDMRVGPIRFSGPVPHGRNADRLGSVMMTRVEEDGFVFVHASDVQLLDRNTVEKILEWKPDVVLASGPPLYRSGTDPGLSSRAWDNAILLAGAAGVLVLDHHLLRSPEGVRWLAVLATRAEGRIVTAAEFMGRPLRFLEAWRAELYREMPVPEGWHEAYARGEANTAPFHRWRDWEAGKEDGEGEGGPAGAPAPRTIEPEAGNAGRGDA